MGRYGWIVSFPLFAFSPCLSLLSFGVGIFVLWFALVFRGLHWYFEDYIGILRLVGCGQIWLDCVCSHLP